MKGAIFLFSGDYYYYFFYNFCTKKFFLGKVLVFKKVLFQKLLPLAAAFGLLTIYAGCSVDGSSSNNNGNEPETPVVTFTLSEYVKDSEITVIKTATPIEGADYTNAYKGVFIKKRKVTLSPFVMSKYEVTQKLYKEVMDGQKVTIDGTEFDLEAEPSSFKNNNKLPANEKQEECPVENVTWYDAVYFCNALSEKMNYTKAYTITVTTVSSGHITAADVALVANANGYRLPTEAEWEFAARGGDTTKPDWNYTFSGAATAEGVSYSASRNTGLDNVGWYWYNICNGGVTSDEEAYSGNEGYGTHQVGLKNENLLGLFDMSGNVWEWCWDWYRSISEETVTDPSGPSSGSDRVIRGGGWNYGFANDCSVSYRSKSRPGGRDNYYLGFRFCRNAN